MASLDEEFKYYQNNKEEFLSKHKGKFIVIKGEKMIGVYDDRMEAIEATRKKHELGTFLVQEVKENDIQTFHSRVLLGDKEDAS